MIGAIPTIEPKGPFDAHGLPVSPIPWDLRDHREVEPDFPSAIHQERQLRALAQWGRARLARWDMIERAVREVPAGARHDLLHHATEHGVESAEACPACRFIAMAIRAAFNQLQHA